VGRPSRRGTDNGTVTMKNHPSSSSPAAIFRVAVAAAAAAAANDTAPSLLAAHSSQRAAVLDCGDCSLSCLVTAHAAATAHTGCTGRSQQHTELSRWRRWMRIGVSLWMDELFWSHCPFCGRSFWLCPCRMNEREHAPVNPPWRITWVRRSAALARDGGTTTAGLRS